MCHAITPAVFLVVGLPFAIGFLLIGIADVTHAIQRRREYANAQKRPPESKSA